METKKFISTLKGFKTRFTNKPDAELEKKSVKGLIEKVENAMSLLDGQDDLKAYVEKVLEIKPVGKVVTSGGKEYADVDGQIYTIDTVKKTVKKVYKDFKDLEDVSLSTEKMPMTIYQRYLRDHFSGEDAPIKKGKLYFRGYRISCDAESGFMLEDMDNHYEVITPFDGVPTPRELGEWFRKPQRNFTPEENTKAAERGRKAKEPKTVTVEKSEQEEPDFEALRVKVLRTVNDARSKTIDVDPEGFSSMIPFKRWKKQVKSLYSQWKEKKIRYAKFLNEVERITKEETFTVEEKRHRNPFVGAILPDFEKVGCLKGNQIEVDGKMIDAVPFLLDYLLHHEKKAMPQLMKYAAGEITEIDLLKNPLEVDWKVEYNKKALENTEHNVKVLCMVYDQVGIIPPHELLYDADLEEGDKILISLDGELKTKTVSSTERGILLGRGFELLKTDKWIKLPRK